MKTNFLAAAIAVLFGRADTSHITHHKGERVGRKDEPNPDSIKTALAAALEQRDANIKSLIEKCDREIAATGVISNETKSALTKQAEAGAALAERMNVMEQEFTKLRDGAVQGGNQGYKSIGQQFCESDEFKGAVGRGSAAFRGTIMLAGLKAVTNVTSLTTGTGGAGVLIQPDRQPGIVGPALRPFTIRDLMMPGRTNSNTIRYVRESGFQNMAGPAAEGTLKPQSDLSFAIADSPVRTLAHWLKASKQILDDVPMLETYIDTRLRYGLKYVEEAQLLSGDGTGENLLGLIPQATAYDTTKNVVGDTKIDTLRRAILQVRIAEYRASAIVLNPADWASIELTKDSVGQYIWVNVATGGEPQLWRLPVVDTNAMPVGKFLVGALNMASQVFDREDSNVQVSTEDGDNFVKNMVTIRAEERLAMVVYRPQSVVYGTFP